MLRIACLFALLGASACAAQHPDPMATTWRKRLQEVMRAPVGDRAQRDEHSRVLVDAVEHDALEGLNVAQVQAAFGQGQPCSGQDLCSQQGFAGDDLYYPVGEAVDDSIKQLPILIVGFDPHGTVKRVYTLKTH